MALAAVTLDDKYTLEKGRIYLTGIQALVRLPMMQRQRDIAAGRNAKTLTVGVKSLFPTSRKLADCGPDLNLERFSELLTHF